MLSLLDLYCTIFSVPSLSERLELIFRTQLWKPAPIFATNSAELGGGALVFLSLSKLGDLRRFPLARYPTDTLFMTVEGVF